MDSNEPSNEDRDRLGRRKWARDEACNRTGQKGEQEARNEQRNGKPNDFEANRLDKVDEDGRQSEQASC